MKRFGGSSRSSRERRGRACAGAEQRPVRLLDQLRRHSQFGGSPAGWGDPVSEGFARISAGIEDTDDLIADIDHALRQPRSQP